jgi:hypothetical protein
MLHNIMASLLLVSSFAHAQAPKYLIQLKNNNFEPAILTVPANKKVKIHIINLDDEPEEFDSFDLNREKVLFPNKRATIYIGPLAPGEYKYFGEFHPNLAKGIIVAKLVNQNKRTSTHNTGNSNAN